MGRHTIRLDSMEPNALPTDIILSQSSTALASLYLNWDPQPGSYVEIAGQTYLVLERRHRYRLRSGRYQLHKIALYVQVLQSPGSRSLLEGKGVIGDISCLYNARSELIRCAVNPDGPCDRCVHHSNLAC